MPSPRPASSPLGSLLDATSGPQPGPKPKPKLLEEMARSAGLRKTFLEEEQRKVWPTHFDVENRNTLAGLAHNVQVLPRWGLKAFGEGFNLVNRALMPANLALGDPIGAAGRALKAGAEKAKRWQQSPEYARAHEATRAEIARREGLEPAPSDYDGSGMIRPVPPPASRPFLHTTGPIDPRIEQARQAVQQELYSDPRSTETAAQEWARRLLGDVADPRIPTIGEHLGETSGDPYLGMGLDMAVPWGPLASAGKLAQGIRGAARFLGGKGTQLTRAELLAQHAAEQARLTQAGLEAAQRAQTGRVANAAARAGMPRLAGAEAAAREVPIVQGRLSIPEAGAVDPTEEIRSLMAAFNRPAPPKLRIPEAAPEVARPKLLIPEAAQAPSKLHIPEATPSPLGQLLDDTPDPAPSGRVTDTPDPAPSGRVTEDYLQTLKPQRGKRAKQAPAGQGDVFQGPAAQAAPVSPLGQLLDNIPDVRPESPWKAPDVAPPVRPDLQFRPEEEYAPTQLPAQEASQARGPQTPAEVARIRQGGVGEPNASAVAGGDGAAASIPTAGNVPGGTIPEVNPAVWVGNVLRSGANRLGFDAQRISRKWGMGLAPAEVEAVFAGRGRPDQVLKVQKSLGMDLERGTWIPPSDTRGVSAAALRNWDQQAELIRTMQFVPPPDPLKVAPMRAGAAAATLRRAAERPRPASFFDEATAPGDLRAGPRSETFMPQDLQVDAKAYQFKEGGDAAGVTDALRGVQTWDRSKSGKAIVHERLDGTYYIADGHQRHGLATRLTREGQPAALDALVYREADGYSIADVRRIAAAKNLAEGTGSAIDAAKVAREVGVDHPDLKSIPKSKHIYRDGEQLAKLGNRAFEEVVNGTVKPEFAAHVGRLIQGDAAQVAALKALRRLKPTSTGEALSIVQDIRAQGLARKTEQGGLFGAEETMEDLLGERAKIFSAAQHMAENDKTLFKAIVRGEGRFQEAGNVLAKDTNRAQITDAERVLAGLEEVKYVGPVAKRLNELARELKAGTITDRAAAKSFLESVRSESAVADAARARPGRSTLEPGGGVDDLEPVPDIEGQDTFFSIEQGRRMGQRPPREPKGQGRLLPDAPGPGPGPKPGERMPAPYELAGQKVHLGRMDVVRRLPMPALVRLSKTLNGSVPDVSNALKALSREMGARVNGRFSGGRVEINPDLFANEDLAAKVLGHEIGHVIDVLGGPKAAAGKAVRSELAKQLAKEPELLREAIKLSEEWRPYDRAGATREFLRYREMPEEVLADFVSVFLNDAALAQKQAPKLTQAFFQSLDKRPEALKALVEVHDMMSGTMGDFVAGLERDLDTSFAKAEDIWRGIREQEAARRASTWERFSQQIRSLFSDSKGEYKRRAQQLEDQGVKLAPHQDPRVSFDEASYSANKRFLLARDWHDKIVEPLRAAGVEEAELGRYLFAQRIANGDRKALANPLGIGPREAKAILKRAENSDVLKQAAKAVRKLYSQALDDALDAGAVGRQEYEAAKSGLGGWAEFALVDNLQGRIPPDIRAQSGSFLDVANPATASFMKVLALRNLAESNRARAAAVKFIVDHYPEEAKLVKPGTRVPIGQAEFRVIEDGKSVTYHVDEWISQSFDGERFDVLSQVARTLAVLDHKVFKPLWITWNLGFQLMNVLRDAQRSTRGFSALGVTSPWRPDNFFRTLASYKGALPHAWSYAKGELDELLREMIEDYAIAPPGESLTDMIGGTQMEHLLGQHGGIGPRPTRQGLAKALVPVEATLDFLQTIGRTLEAVPKVAGYQRLGKANITGPVRARIVRDYVGTPNFRIKGAATPVTNNILIFSNIALQSWKADAQLLLGPRTRSGAWIEMVKHGLMPKMLMAAAAYGALEHLSPGLKEMYDAIGEYDKTQFVCIPLGWEEGGEHGKRVRYIRLPLDETARFFGGLAWKAAHGKNSGKDLEDWAADTFKFAAGQLVPDAGPSAKISGVVAEVLKGNNPDDDFTGAPIVRQKEFDAGGWARWRGVLRWSVGQFGMLGEVVRNKMNEGSTKQAYSWTMATPPGLNRFFRVSDRGFSEAQRQDQHNTNKAKKKIQAGYGDKTKEISNTYFRLQKTGRDRRTVAQEQAYRVAGKFYNGAYKRTQHHIQQLLEEGHTPDAAILQAQLEKDAVQYYDLLNKLTGRTER